MAIVLRIDVVNLAVDRPDIFANGLVGIDIPIVLPTEEAVEAEAAGLNALNSDKGYRYLAWMSRFYPEGRPGRT